jgi:hypothetical protein
MKTLLKLAGCWLAFVAALAGTGVISRIFHLASVQTPGNTPISIQILALLGAAALLVLGFYPLARGLCAEPRLRALAIGGFFFIALGVNGVIEARFFTHLLDQGIASAEVFYALEALLIGAAFGFFFGETGQVAGLPRHGLLGWTGRGIAAWLSWPVIYFFFGACISPIVVPYYSAGIAGLHIPPLQTIFALQLLRSVLFLGCSLPFVALWKGSRRSLWFALGLTHAMVVGIYGLAAATSLPWVLRMTHGVEITCDSFAYAGLLVLLFAAPGTASKRAMAAGLLARGMQSTS